jgi:hypothetical protein
MKSHKYKTGRRVMNWRVWVIVLTIISVWVMSHYGNMDNTYTREHATTTVAVLIKAEVRPTIEEKIKQYFPRSHKTITAIAHAESHMNVNAKGYNCFYNEDETIVYTSKVKNSHSTSCKKSHRSFAWSVDCGLLQLNSKGKVCPKETIDEHLQRAANLSRIQGTQAWVTYNNNLHIKYLAQQ